MHLQFKLVNDSKELYDLLVWFIYYNDKNMSVIFEDVEVI